VRTPTAATRSRRSRQMSVSAARYSSSTITTTRGRRWRVVRASGRQLAAALRWQGVVVLEVVGFGAEPAIRAVRQLLEDQAGRPPGRIRSYRDSGALPQSASKLNDLLNLALSVPSISSAAPRDSRDAGNREGVASRWLFALRYERG
jgi:hypothetical protein